MTLEQLAAQVAALQAAVDGMTAPPADYYTLLKSGEEVDAILSRAAPGGEIDASLSNKAALWQLVNSNLLDNWYFPAPINQRGQTSYPSSGYTIDRWTLSGTGGIVELETGQIKLSCDGTGLCYFSQKYEHAEQLRGKMISTALLCRASTGSNFILYSYDYADGANICATPIPPSGDWSLVQIQGVVPDIAHAAGQVSYAISGRSGTLEMIATKFELGSQQTLAHQDESGNWVINEIPDYGTELAKCQRYQFLSTVGQSEFIRADNITTNAIYFCLPTPVTMRTTPVLESSAALGLTTMSNAAQSGFQFSYVLLNNGIRVVATKSNHGLTDARLDIAKALFTCNL